MSNMFNIYNSVVLAVSVVNPNIYHIIQTIAYAKEKATMKITETSVQQNSHHFFSNRFKKSIVALTMITAMAATTAWSSNSTAQHFNRVSTFPVYLNSDVTNETVAEIVAATNNGNTLVYTDGKMNGIGFVNITDIAAPVAAGFVGVGGEPTSVAVFGDYVLAAVNISSDFINTSGNLVVIDSKTKSIVRAITLDGQPDSIAVSPDGQYAAIAIENERDEDLGDGVPPQAPAGFLTIIDLDGKPSRWSVRNVSLVGLATLYSDDPEPEHIDINKNNIAVITLQENNHIVLVDLKDGEIIEHFSTGKVTLNSIDASKDKQILLNETLTDVFREPDGVSWMGNKRFATANEGDLDGGSRGFTIFNLDGSIAYESKETVEHIITAHGHFPDKRAEKKGNEPENVEYGIYGDGSSNSNKKYLFVGSERSSLVLVYRVADNAEPEFIQALPSPVKPEGLLAIPERNLFIVAGEEDNRDDKIRSALSIYKLQDGNPSYPEIISVRHKNNVPIGWGALSGLTVNPQDKNTAYTVQDSFYGSSRIFKLDISQTPAVIIDEIIITGSKGILNNIAPSLVNKGIDKTVNLDLEGITVSADGGFWIVSEGKGSSDDPKKPFVSVNLLIRPSSKGIIKEVVTLPSAVNNRQLSFGFEGCTTIMKGNEELIFVVFQRPWKGDAANLVRIGQYNSNTGKWTFFYYPLNNVASKNGGWVGLSGITALENNEFLVIERDNQSGTDAAIKRIYRFSINGLIPLSDDGSDNIAYPIVIKTLANDLMDKLVATGGQVLEKIEGITVIPDGTVLIVNDNDGVDDSNGETRLLRLKGIL
jgi:hypothetical protein